MRPMSILCNQSSLASSINQIKLSIVIPSKSNDDPKLSQLLKSIEVQGFPKDQLEILVITEGTSESAKAIGFRLAKGEVIGILASDNELISEDFFSIMYQSASKYGSSNPLYYYYKNDDNILNRYFSLIGGNDPLAFYMNKNDKASYQDNWSFGPWRDRTFGDNGFFVRKSLIEKTDLDNYYHIDNATEIENTPEYEMKSIWHKTGGNIFKFFIKRYKYGLQHAFNSNRRWHLVNFNRKEDICRLVFFIVVILTIIHPLIFSIRGYIKIRDLAWFLHPITCLMTLFTYCVLMMRVGFFRLFQLLFAPTEDQNL